MSRTIKQFDFQLTKMAKGDSLPFDPHVVIVLGHWGTSNGGAPTISADLMTAGEVDEYVEALKSDLDAVAKKAKAALGRAKEATRAIVSERNST